MSKQALGGWGWSPSCALSRERADCTHGVCSIMQVWQIKEDSFCPPSTSCHKHSTKRPGAAPTSSTTVTAALCPNKWSATDKKRLSIKMTIPLECDPMSASCPTRVCDDRCHQHPTPWFSLCCWMSEKEIDFLFSSVCGFPMPGSLFPNCTMIVAIAKPTG